MESSCTKIQGPKTCLPAGTVKDQNKSKIQRSKIKTLTPILQHFLFSQKVLGRGGQLSCQRVRAVWNLVIGISFVIFNLSFVILLGGCGDITTGLASITLSPTRATVGVNQAQLFTAIGKNSSGIIVSTTFTWSVTGGIGTISSTGLFIAGSTSGEGTVIASAEGISKSAAVTVTDQGWVAGRVLDELGQKIASIKVYLKNTSLFDFTDSSGDYSISAVPAGTYEVWTLGTSVYKAASEEATVSQGKTTTANFIIYYFNKPPDLTPPEYPTD